MGSKSMRLVFVGLALVLLLSALPATETAGQPIEPTPSPAPSQSVPAITISGPRDGEVVHALNAVLSWKAVSVPQTNFVHVNIWNSLTDSNGLGLGDWYYRQEDIDFCRGVNRDMLEMMRSMTVAQPDEKRFYQIRVMEAVQFGNVNELARGISMAVPLAPGENRIAVEIRNDQGSVILSKTITVTCRP